MNELYVYIFSGKDNQGLITFSVIAKSIYEAERLVRQEYDICPRMTIWNSSVHKLMSCRIERFVNNQIKSCYGLYAFADGCVFVKIDGVEEIVPCVRLWNNNGYYDVVLRGETYFIYPTIPFYFEACGVKVTVESESLLEAWEKFSTSPNVPEVFKRYPIGARDEDGNIYEVKRWKDWNVVMLKNKYGKTSWSRHLNEVAQ